MRIIQPITENMMVAHFLQTEIHSARYRDTILALLARDGQDSHIVEMPNLEDEDANVYRAQLLGDFRGYRQQRELFDRFPEEVAWYRAMISKEELACVRYIDYSYWNELSGGSRLPSQAADNIRAGVEVFGVSNDNFWKTAQAVREGVRLSELILVGTSLTSLIVLEGHVRLTAYFLTPEYIPNELSVMVGLSSDFADWE